MTTSINSIVPHLWFDKEASEAVSFYISVFPDSKIITRTRIENTPSGNVEILTFELRRQKFMAISAGPLFRFNQAISFFVYCGSDTEIESVYKKLSKNGSVLMPLEKYEWSRKYAWVRDKYGLSWQLEVDDVNDTRKILPSLLFVNEKASRVKEAVNFYTSVFPKSGVIMESPYDKTSGMPEGSLLFAQFSLSGFLFNSMSSTLRHDYDFNESVSFMVYCHSQEEIDYFWEKLTEGGEEQQCGWLKDKFGVAWQIVPAEMDEMMSTANKEQSARVTSEMLKMVKLDIKVLRKAYNAVPR
jgi:predicted 3-demethylubiquinone-9 3-methyltransferase (glyoxalase superfamily)